MIRIGRDLLALDAVASTNDVAWTRAAEGAPDGFTVTAEHQTAGRGRFGRAWHAPRGLALAVSIVLRPKLPAERLPLLTAAAAVAATETAVHFGASAGIRWPNDVVAGGKKLAGVIVEGRDGSAFVLGCGFNVNLETKDFPDDLRDTSSSLKIETGKIHDRAKVLRFLLEALDTRYDQALTGSPALGEDWKKRSALLLKKIRIWEGGKEHRGEVVDLDVLEGISIRLAETGSVRRFRLEHVEKLRQE